MKNQEITYTVEPFECFVRVHHNADGELTLVEVAVNGTVPVRRYRDPGETAGVLFDEAFEAAKVLMLSRRVSNPIPGEPT